MSSANDRSPFVTMIPVRFAHVDAAGILFYPRYFEMLNQVVEDWFGAGLGRSFRDLHLQDRSGVPTVRLEAEFLQPSELGDELRFELAVNWLGRSSCELAVDGSCDGSLRLRTRVTLVYMDLQDRRARPWPSALRAGIERYLTADARESG